MRQGRPNLVLGRKIADNDELIDAASPPVKSSGWLIAATFFPVHDIACPGL
jgi:hypothetical protein